jgi:hypothetical protein
MQRTKQLLTFLVIVLVGWFTISGMGTIKASAEEMSVASMIYLVCCIPALLYFLRSEATIPYMPLFGFIYFFYFGFSVFNNYNLFVINGLTKESIVKTLQMSLAGISSLLVAFYSPLGSIVDTLAMPVNLPWDPKKALKFAFFSAVIGFPMLYLTNSGKMLNFYGAMVGFLVQFSRLSIIILVILGIQGRLKQWHRWLLWAGLVPLQIFLSISSGATFTLMVDICLVFFLFIYFTKSLHLFKAVCAATMFFLIFSVRDDFRQQTWYGEASRKTPIGRAQLYFKLIYEKVTSQEKDSQYFSSAYERLSGRSDSLMTFVKVVDMTPAVIPYWNGYTYSTFLYSFIPRIILPNKPIKNLGQDFGHRYNLLLYEDTVTSYNFPVVIEMYANFGFYGIVVGMFLIGLFLRWFYRTFNHENAGECGIVLTVIVLVNILVLESDFGLIFGPVLYYIILFLLILKKIQYSEKIGAGGK